MKKMSPRKLISGILAAAGLLILVVVLFMQASRIGQDEPPSSHPITASKSREASSPVQKLPSGIERSLLADIPLVGKIQGTRWIAGHTFQTLMPKDHKEGFLVDRGLDVLVDNEGNFVTARFNGERFATTPHEASLKNLLRNATFHALKTAGESSPKVPEITKVTRARIRWDDPDLGDSIRKLVNRAFEADHYDNALSRFEENYYAFEVWYAGEPKPHHIVVRRYTEGLAEGGVPFPPNGLPRDAGDAVRNSNRHGASVISMAWEIGSPRDLQGPMSLLYLTEPWAGPCPWPLDKLDPYYGDNRLNEFVMPTEYSTGEMPDLFDWHPNMRDPRADFIVQAEKNKADRLAQER